MQGKEEEEEEEPDSHRPQPQTKLLPVAFPAIQWGSGAGLCLCKLAAPAEMFTWVLLYQNTLDFVPT